jgi:N-acetylmuramic acid 6-phosphate etherase
MKAGTAQKLILNMITTAAMIRTGKVYGNLMVNLEATNKKLVERGKRIVRLATDCTQEEAEQALAQCKGNVKSAILMLLTGVTAAEAIQRLEQSQGIVAHALEVDNA